MSRVYEALRRMDLERRGAGGELSEPAQPVEFLQSVVPQPADLGNHPTLRIDASAASRLIALTDQQALGAEKFRALATRLENLQSQRELKTFQVTSGLPNEGKTTVATNLAITLAQKPGLKVLLVEGDLHRPAIQSVLGQSNLRGISHWWSEGEGELCAYLYRLGELPLWFLPAGRAVGQPSSILQSARFAEGFLRLTGMFGWIIVDSTPLLPFVDTNLWSRMLDAMLLVAREGVASTKALKKGLEAIDNPNLIGVVLNDATDSDQERYHEKYYGLSKRGQELTKA